jgi:hypothetical protein
MTTHDPNPSRSETIRRDGWELETIITGEHPVSVYPRPEGLDWTSLKQKACGLLPDGSPDPEAIRPGAMDLEYLRELVEEESRALESKTRREERQKVLTEMGELYKGCVGKGEHGGFDCYRLARGITDAQVAAQRP